MAREKIMLTAEQTTKLKALEDDIAWLQTEIDRAKTVGIDVTDLEERFKKMKSIRQRVLQEYGQ